METQNQITRTHTRTFQLVDGTRIEILYLEGKWAESEVTVTDVSGEEILRGQLYKVFEERNEVWLEGHPRNAGK